MWRHALFGMALACTTASALDGVALRQPIWSIAYAVGSVVFAAGYVATGRSGGR